MSFCIECGAKQPVEGKFCVACGAKMLSPDQNQNPESKSQIPNPQSPISSPQNPATQSPTYPVTQLPSYPATQSSGFFARVKGITFKPLEEWLIIEGETPNVNAILLRYVLPLLLIPALSVFIGIGLIGQSFGGYQFTSLPAGAIQGVIQLLAGIISIRITAYLITLLAPGFDSVKDYGRAIQLVCYSMTPYWLLGILYILPSFPLLKSGAMLAGGIYSIYLMYKGMPVLLKTPAAKSAAFLALLIIIQFAIMFCLAWIFGLIAPMFL